MMNATREKTRLWLLLLIGVVATLLGQTHAREIFAPSPHESGVFAPQTQASTGENYDGIQYDALDSLLAAKGGDELVNLASSQRTTHILTGDATGGGHLFPGAPGKTAFPHGWSGDQVMHHISDIATDPALKWVPQTGSGGWFTKAGNPARFSVEGVRDGTNIKVILEPAGEGIITAFPK